MRILIVGANGMLGSRVSAHLVREGHQVASLTAGPSAHGLCGTKYPGIDATNRERMAELFRGLEPEAVINCAGIVKRRPGGTDPYLLAKTNALMPHQLAHLCEKASARFIHISTDCVFSGKRGSYKEADAPDPTDFYGMSKALGEVRGVPHALTLRTSIVGLEVEGASRGLVEWFLSEVKSKGAVTGYDGAIFSGLITAELARVIEMVLLDHPALSGLYQVASSPISKYALLKALACDELGLEVEITKDTTPRENRTLLADRFATATGYKPPSWPTMVAELAYEIRERPS